MRSDIFVEWLYHLDNWFHIMDQKILLLIDNAASHFNPKMFDKDSSDLSEDDDSKHNCPPSANGCWNYPQF